MVLVFGVAVVLWQNRCLPPTRTRRTNKPTNTLQTPVNFRKVCIVRRKKNFVRLPGMYHTTRKKTINSAALRFFFLRFLFVLPKNLKRTFYLDLSVGGGYLAQF